MEAKFHLEKVTSPDGTSIACHRSGAGPPLILVHGSGAANAHAWTAVLPTLKQHFSLYVVDRRGHGQSGDDATYAIEREFEDIAAVVDSPGQPAHLLGDSFGGLCALEAALLTRNLHKLVLYEPPMPLPGVPSYPEGVIDQFQARLDADDPEGVLIIHYRDVVKIPRHEIERLRSSPAWPARLAAGRTLPREARAEEQYTFAAQRFADLPIPTLLLLSGDSPPFMREATETVNAALPDSPIAIMPGQQHTAMYTAPDRFLHEVLTFLIGPR